MSSEIGVRLSGDNTEFKKMMSESAEKAGEFSTKIAEKIGDKLYGLRDISHVVATALGLNLEKIAENLARALAGMTEGEQEIYKQLDELSKKTADNNIAAMRSRLTEQQKYQLALIKEAEIEASIPKLIEEQAAARKEKAEHDAEIFGVVNNEKLILQQSLEIEEKRNAASELHKEIVAYENTQKKEAIGVEKEVGAAERARGEAAQKAADALLPLLQQRAILEAKVGELEQIAGHEMQVNKKSVEDTNKLREKQNELADINRKINEQTVKAAEAIEKARFDALTNQEKSVYLAGLIETADRAIANLEAQGLDASDAKNFKELKLYELKKLSLEISKSDTEEKKKQTAEINHYLEMTADAIVSEKKRVEIAIAEARALGLQTEELQRQLDIINKIITKKIVADGLNGRPATAIDDNYSVKVSGSEDVSTESTDQLIGHLQKLEEEKRHAGQGGGALDPSATVASNYADWLTNSLFNAAEKKIQDEINSRNAARDYANRYGQAAAVQQFGDSLVQRALQGITDQQTQTTSLLGRLDQRLSNSGFFPLNGGG